MNEKGCLEAVIKNYKSLCIAFSGGCDSTLLAAVALEVLGRDNVLLVNVDSPLTPAAERVFAGKWAADNNCQYISLKMNPVENDDIRENPVERCYFCKKYIFGKVLECALEHGFEQVADGTNKDDFNDFRPGLRASGEMGIKHPLAEAGFDKNSVRILAREMNLPNADTPASACLASRVPYGVPLDSEMLVKIDCAEEYLRLLGISVCRVRLEADSVRVETAPEEFAQILEKRGYILDKFREIGFENVCLDLKGYRMGGGFNPATDAEADQEE